MDIHLHIDELVLHGFYPRDRDGIAEAIAHELTKLLGEQAQPSLLSKGGEIGDILGATIDMAAGSSPETIGTNIAQAVLRGFQ